MIGLIFAQSSNGFIGKDGQLLFQIPEDMKRFKDLTEGGVVIMGRKTWESLPEKFRPLPNRTNIVLTRERVGNFENAEIATDLESVLLNLHRQSETNVWIIGGESVYSEAIEYADVIHQTLVTKEFEGDARAPFIEPEVWVPETGKPFKEHQGLYYQFNTYRRKVKVV